MAKIAIVNRTRGHLICEGIEEDTSFAELQKEYGRCISKVYVDTPDGKAKPVGWVFVKRQRYTDANEFYIQETWVDTTPIVGRWT
jgi:hypothetical protein